MNHSINFEGDWALHGIMSDLGVNYALSPFHRIGFEIDDAGIQTLAERYHDRVFRARKWFDHDTLSWTTEAAVHGTSGGRVSRASHSYSASMKALSSSPTATGATPPKSSRRKPAR